MTGLAKLKMNNKKNTWLKLVYKKISDDASKKILNHKFIKVCNIT